MALDTGGASDGAISRSASSCKMKYTDEQIFDALASFFVQAKTSREGATVAPDTDIIGQGFVDSLGIFKLIAYVEETFGITIEPDEVLLENFQTLRALRNLIVKKLGSVGEAQAVAS
jgi:acyl carrier protein